MQLRVTIKVDISAERPRELHDVVEVYDVMQAVLESNDDEAKAQLLARLVREAQVAIRIFPISQFSSTDMLFVKHN